MRLFHVLTALCLALFPLYTISNAMPSTSKSPESTDLSIRRPGNLDLYYHESGNALAERSLPTVAILALIPASMGVSAAAVYHNNAGSLTLGFGTEILAIAFNIYYFWWLEGWKELSYGLKEAENTCKQSEQNLQNSRAQEERDNAIHPYNLEKAVFEARVARLKFIADDWGHTWMTRVEDNEIYANRAPSLKRLWVQAKEDVDAVEKTGFTGGERERESKMDKAEASTKALQNKIIFWLDTARQILEPEAPTPEGNGTSSRKARRSRMPRDRLPNLDHEYCVGGVCNRVWYSNSQQGSGWRTMTASEIIHKVYLTPIDYDFRTPVHQKRKVPIPIGDVMCGEEEDYKVGKQPYSSLELKGGNITDLEQIVNYVTSDRADAEHEIEEQIEKGPKAKDEEGNEVTVIAREGWTCISLDTPGGGQPAIWGLYGLFEDPTQLHANHDKEWNECKNKLHA